MDGGHSYILTFGFGTTVAMWAIGYVSRIPPVWIPSSLLLFLLLLCLIGGGFLAGSMTGRGVKAGLSCGALASALNLLVLGSLLGGSSANHLVPSALWWVPGSVAVGAVLGAAGGLLGAARRGPAVRTSADWTAGFAAVAAAATLVLVAIGGVVTSEDAGLSVVDWPTSFGYNMFLYPLSRMTGGVYFEHAHRLFGSLVGLTTLVLAIHLWRVERRPRVRYFALGALVLVMIQGLLGGLRVTGHFTTSTSPADTRPSLALAVVHGVTGQLFFGALVALSAFTSATWISRRAATRGGSASTDQGISAVLVGALILQLIAGAILRHTDRGLIAHVSIAVFVTVLVVTAGTRATWLHRGQPILERLGRTLLVLVSLQIVLGILSLVARGPEGADASHGFFRVLVTTAHQVNGGLLLAAAVLLLAWNHRLLEPESGASRDVKTV